MFAYQRRTFGTFTPMAFPYRSFMPPIAGYLISYRFLSLFPKDNSGIHGLLPDFYGGNSFYAVPKRSPTSVQLLLHSNNVVQHIPIPMKSVTQQGLFTFAFANSPTGSSRWNISVLAFLCIRSHERQIIYMRLGYTGTCRKAIRQRHPIFFFPNPYATCFTTFWSGRVV